MRKLALILFLAILVGLGWGGYTYRDTLRSTRLGKLVTGAAGQQQSKDIYYCPMHPDYKSDKPGTCPICNMNLEKMEPQQQAAAPGGKPSEKPGAAGAPSGDRKVLYWVDPMNPDHKSDKPGKAPDGMDLVPVYADESSSGKEALPPGTVQINAQKQQLIGVQYGTVALKPLSRVIRTVGKVTYDETKISRIQTRIEGWIEKVYVDFTGKLVQKGQPLMSLYSPQLVSTQQELLIAKKSKDYLESSPFKQVGSSAVSLYDSTRERLRLWDISDAQIRDIERRGKPTTSMTINSPISGYVLTRNAFEGQRITPETELYSIADLSTIWVLADVYEYEIPMIRLGQTATMSLSYLPGKVFKGKVTYIYPELDKVSRTLKVRLEFANPNLELKPDMFANVELNIDYGKQLVVPEEAVLDSGMEQVVFVDRGDGYFEPRKVTLGQKVGSQYVIKDGLKPGERIVTSGNFLIDSESRLKSAIGDMSGGAHAEHAADGGATHAGTDMPDMPSMQPQSGTANEPTGHEATGRSNPADRAAPDHPGHMR